MHIQMIMHLQSEYGRSDAHRYIVSSWSETLQKQCCKYQDRALAEFRANMSDVALPLYASFISYILSFWKWKTRGTSVLPGVCFLIGCASSQWERILPCGCRLSTYFWEKILTLNNGNMETYITLHKQIYFNIIYCRTFQSVGYMKFTLDVIILCETTLF